ncbi:MAG: hypothetical protein PHN84_03315 [Desulfuromonadaceae bacterium]|nr:hypothetical protein [Desulfuromonadaceae bacterium]
MQIRIIKRRFLNSLNRNVKVGEVLESPKDVTEALLTAYVNNGIAEEIKAAPVTYSETEPEIIDGGE